MNELRKIYERQKEYDDMVFESREAPSQSQVLMAMLDEIGELTHELKGEWCWWKLTQEPVKRHKVLEELIDVLHFAVCYTVEFGGEQTVEESLYNAHIKCLYRTNPSEYDNVYVTEAIYTLCVSAYRDLIEYLTADVLNIGFLLGFTPDEIVNEYFKKNDINIERIRTGY